MKNKHEIGELTQKGVIKGFIISWDKGIPNIIYFTNSGENLREEEIEIVLRNLCLCKPRKYQLGDKINTYDYVSGIMFENNSFYYYINCGNSNPLDTIWKNEKIFE